MDTREVASQYRLGQWTEIVRQCRSSGQPVAVWCAENNISITSYYYRLRRIREAACEALPSLSANHSMVPVDIPVHNVEADSSNQASSSDIVVRMGSVTLEISNNASATLIEATLRALQHVR